MSKRDRRALRIMLAMFVVHWLWLPIMAHAPYSWRFPILCLALAWFAGMIAFGIYHAHRGAVSGGER